MDIDDVVGVIGVVVGVPPHMNPHNVEYLGPLMIEPRLDMVPGDFRHITAREGVRQSVRSAWLRLNERPELWNQISQIDLDAGNEDAQAIAYLRLVEILSEVHHWGGGAPFGVDRIIEDCILKTMYSIARNGWDGYIAAEVHAHHPVAAPVVLEAPVEPVNI
jgi:hypothetical protein